MKILWQLIDILLINPLILLNKCLDASNFSIVAGIIRLDPLLLAPGAELKTWLKLFLLISIPCDISWGSGLPFAPNYLLVHVNVSF